MILVAGMMSAMLYEVVARRFFNAPTLWANDITYMSNGTIFLIGAAFTLRMNGHVRIDFLSTRLPLRFQHSINLVFHAVLMLPALYLLDRAAWQKAWRAWVRGEVEAMSAWEPLVWPFYLGIAVGLTGLLIQVAAQSIRHVAGIVDPSSVPGPSESEAQQRAGDVV
jgi:TRAP-type mannitol/chloroaromatic compound transport system permease small subunit